MFLFKTVNALFIAIIILFKSNSNAQTSIEQKSVDKQVFNNIDSLGLNSNPRLSKFESEYFNSGFSKRSKGFNFTNKKIAFVTGSSGKTISDKQKYFALEKERIYKNYSLNGGTIILFDENEKVESGGYDAVILYWSKVLPTKKQLIKLLKENN